MFEDQDSDATVDNFLEDAESAPTAPPCAMVIFGAAGDLTKRLVAPALYNLSRAKRLSDGFRLVGVDLANQDVADWRRSLTEMMEEFSHSDGASPAADFDRSAWRFLTDRMSYLQGDLNDPGTYRRLGEHLAAPVEGVEPPGNHLFYLAIAYLEVKGVRQSTPMARKLLERAYIDNDNDLARRLLKMLPA